jgi:tetratricopeptide (TPR) repeat protein
MAKRPQKKRRPTEIDRAAASTQMPRAGALEQPWWRREWLWGLLLVAAVFLAYQPVWRAGFIWDDDMHVTANPCIVGPLGLKEIWTTSAARICPLVLTTFWVEHALWGLHPLPYHLINVFMHAAGALALWRVLRSLQVPGAWLGAALWALHPVQAETVAWITELKNTQSGLFYLLSILFFVKGLKAGATGDRRGDRWNYAWTLLFAALAMTSKSSTVVLPVVLCLCGWWVEGRWRGRNLAKVAPLVLMAALACAVSMWTQGLDAAADPSPARSGPERLVTAGRVVWFYLGKLLWPHPLIFIYPRWTIHADRGLSYVPLVALVLVLLVLWRGRQSWARPYFFALAYFVTALLPVLGLVDHYFLRYSFVGDHFQYLASMGPLALAGAGITTALGSLTKANRFLEPAVGGALLVTLGVLTWSRGAIYHDSETLWRTTIAQNPACWMARDNLGAALLLNGRLTEAEDDFNQALRIKPDDATTHFNLGSAFFHEGRFSEAIDQFEQDLQIKPRDAEARDCLGDALLSAGRATEAMEQYEQALQIKPDDAKIHYPLAVALLKTGHPSEAIDQFEQTLRLNPDDAEAYNKLGAALFQTGQVPEAMEQYEQALRLKPDFAEAYYNLANALRQTGRVSEAIDQYQQALRVSPDFAEAHNNLGGALQMAGRLTEAMDQYEQALRLKPDLVSARNNLARLRALQQAVPSKP